MAMGGSEPAHGADATFPSDPAQHLYATSGDVESSASAQQQSIYADTPGGNEDAGMSLPQSEHGGTVPVNGTYSDTTTATDPLGRLTARYPIATFGFGGKMAVMFPRQVQRFNGYSTDGALKVTPGMLQIQSLSEHIPSNRGLPDSSSLASLPLVAGDLTRSALLKRRDAAIARAQACLETGPSTRTLSHVDRALYAVVIALLRAADQPDSQSLNLDEAIAAIRPLLAERHPQSQDECVREPAPISHGTVADLGDVEALLLDGKRDAAIDLACERGMWAHALIVASCTGKKTWQRVVQAYTEKGLKSGFAALSAQYCLFAGLGEDAFDELQGTYGGAEGASENGFITAADIGDLGSPETAPSHPGALDQSPSAESASSDIVDDWARVLMLALANRTPGDAAAMLKLGDRLKKRDQAVAAHICYALTLQNRDIFVRDHSSPRAILFGTAELDCSSKSPHAFEIARPKYSCYYREHGALFLTELYELAFALKNATLNESAAAKAASNGGAQASKQKGGNLLCLPHLQAYKLYYAWWLVDCGQMVQAAQYCDAVLGILATLPQGIAVPFIHASLVQELRNLRERLSGAGMTPAKAVGIAGDNAAAADANSKSWIARAVPRPSFTTLMTAFDSSIDKFITGADGSRISLEAGAAPGKYEVGPDRHGAPPAKISDQPPNPPRPLGATAWGGGANPANAPSQSDAYIPSYGSPRQSMDTARYSSTQTPVNGGSEPPRMYTPSSFAAHADVGPANATQPQWGDPGGVAQDAAQDGFIVPGMALGASAPGFIPEPVHSNGNTSSAPYQPSPQQAPAGGHDSNAQGRNGDGYADGEEDIFGFSKRVKTPVASAPGTTRPSVDAAWNKPASARPSTDMRARSDSQGGDKEASGVLGMIKSFWGGRKNQANLGEESQFVYDPVQRRWVDKNAPSDQQQSAPPPPPPPSAMRFQAQEMGDMRSGSAASLPPPSTGPSRTGTPMSIPDVGLPASRPPPPPSAPGARGGKRRGARSRYVDVLNQ
ncbi:hypothetical protein GGF46_004784 [Coemansia sp. RSA 552]|nr:hypothetical protein GGF46_004784 [Coemansia sp. RSA 552]